MNDQGEAYQTLSVYVLTTSECQLRSFLSL